MCWSTSVPNFTLLDESAQLCPQAPRLLYGMLAVLSTCVDITEVWCQYQEGTQSQTDLYKDGLASESDHGQTVNLVRVECGAPGSS